jgi:hypothetical protein
MPDAISLVGRKLYCFEILCNHVIICQKPNAIKRIKEMLLSNDESYIGVKIGVKKSMPAE